MRVVGNGQEWTMVGALQIHPTKEIGYERKQKKTNKNLYTKSKIHTTSTITNQNTNKSI